MIYVVVPFNFTHIMYYDIYIELVLMYKEHRSVICKPSNELEIKAVCCLRLRAQSVTQKMGACDKLT